MATTQFEQIYHGLSPEVGSKYHIACQSHIIFIVRLEFRVAPPGMAWKGVDSEGVVSMASTDIKWAQWIRVARNFQLRVGMRDHRKENFDGFMREVGHTT